MARPTIPICLMLGIGLGCCLAAFADEGPDAMGTILDIQVQITTSGDLDKEKESSKEDGKRYKYESHHRHLKDVTIIEACVVEQNTYTHTAQRCFVETDESESFWEDPQKSCGPMDPNDKPRLGHAPKQKVVHPGDSEKRVDKKTSRLYAGEDLPPPLKLANITFWSFPSWGGRYRLSAGYRGYMAFEGHSTTTYKYACDQKTAISETIYRTLDSLTAPLKTDYSGDDDYKVMAITSPPSPRNALFIHEGTLSDGGDGGAEVKEGNNKGDEWQEKVSNVWRITPRNVCAQVSQKLDFELSGAEAYSDEGLRRQAVNSENYEDLVARKMYEQFNGKPPPDCFPNKCRQPSACGPEVTEQSSVSNELWVNPTTCAIKPELLANWQKQQQRECMPSIITHTVLAHENQHVIQCHEDKARFGGASPMTKGQSETSAYLHGAGMYLSWLDQYCPDRSERASQHRRFEAVKAKDNGW